MNEADSQYIADRAASAGLCHRDASPKMPTSLVLNTCTVRDNAERRAYGRMGHFKVLKDARPAAQAGRDGLSGRARPRPDAEARAARRRGLRHARTPRARRSARCLAAGFRRRRLYGRRARCSTARRDGAMPSSARSRICARSSTCSAAVRTTARSASCRTCAGRFDHRPRARIVDEVREQHRRRRARNHAGRTDRQRVEGSGDGRRLRRSVQGSCGAAGPRAVDVYLAASQRFHREDDRRSGRCAAARTRACICRCNRPAIRFCGG